jgi:hypothetical protein
MIDDMRTVYIGNAKTTVSFRVDVDTFALGGS